MTSSGPPGCSEPVSPPTVPPTSTAAPSSSAGAELRLFARCAATAAIAHLFVHLVLSPGNPLLGSPVHSDDFVNLAHTSFRWGWPAVRPVSELLIRALSAGGEAAFYAALHLLSVLHVALVFTFVCLLLGRRPSLLLLLAGTVPAMALEPMVERYRYTGSITSLTSGTLGTAGLVVLWGALDGPVTSRVRLLLGVALAVLALLAKEDTQAAILLVVAYPAVFGASTAGRRNARLALGILLLASAMFAVHGLWLSPSPFLGAAGSYHVVDLRPASVAWTTLRFLTLTPGARLAAVGMLAAAAVALWLGLLSRSRMALVAATVLALIAPYAVLPARVYAYYAPNWVPWELALVLAVAAAASEEKLLATAAVAGLAVASIAVTAPGRAQLLRFYADQGARSQRTLARLRTLHPVLALEDRVAVLGVPTLNPWRVNDGSYLANRLGLAPRWFVYVDDGYLASLARYGIPLDRGLIATRSISEFGRLGEMPVLVFRPDGSLTLARAARAGPAGPARLSVEPRRAAGDRSSSGIADVAWWAPASRVALRERAPDERLITRGPGAGAAVVGGISEGMLLTLESDDGTPPRLLAAGLVAGQRSRP